MTDELLVKRAKQGDGEAFVLLVRKQENRLFNIAYKILGNDQDCADVLQETMLKAYLQINTLKNEAYFQTWLCRILINECKNLLEKNKRFSTIDIEKINQDKYYSQNKTDESEFLMEFITKTLNPIYSIPLILYYQSGFSIKEIGLILNEPIGTIKSKLARGKILLKRTLKDLKEDE